MHKKPNTFGRMTSRHSQFILYLAIVLLLNLVGVRVFKHIRLDLTEKQSYTLSQVSKDTVKSLADPMRVKAFFSKNLPAQYEPTERYLKDLLSEYNRSGNRNFSFEFYDCTISQEDSSEKVKKNIKMANDLGIYSVNVRNDEHDEIKVTRAYMGIAIQHGDMIERIQFLENTSGLEYRLTTIMSEMVSKISALQAIEGKIQVNLFLPETFKTLSPLFQISGVDGISKAVAEAIEKAMPRNFEKLEFNEIKEDASQDTLAKLRGLGALTLNWPGFKSPTTGQQMPDGSGYAAIIMDYAGQSRVLDLLTTQQMLRMTGGGLQAVDAYQVVELEDIEERINGMVDSLLNVSTDLAYLSDKGSVDTSPSSGGGMFGQQQGGEAANFASLVRQVYNFKPVPAIDAMDSAGVLVIAGPTEKFTDYELFQIDQHLMKGNSLIVFNEGVDETQSNPMQAQFGQFSPPTYQARNTGLEKLLSHYGVEIEHQFVFDKQCFIQPGNNPHGGGAAEPQNVYIAPRLSGDQINQDFPVLKNINNAFVLRASPLKVEEEQLKEKGFTVTKLLESSEEAWAAENIQSAMRMPAPESDLKQYTMAYLVEGEFESYFAEKGIPQPEEEGEEKAKTANASAILGKVQAENTFIKKGKPGKLIVVSSSDVIKNNLIPANGQSEIGTIVVNLIDYLADRVDWAKMRSKTQSFSPIENYDPKASAMKKLMTNRNYVIGFNVAGLPILVVLIGFFVYQKRTKRRQAIKQDFN